MVVKWYHPQWDGEMKDTLKPPTKINGMCSYIPVGQTPETWVNYGLYMDREFHSIKLIPGELVSSHFINPSGIGSQTAPQRQRQLCQDVGLLMFPLKYDILWKNMGT